MSTLPNQLRSRGALSPESITTGVPAKPSWLAPEAALKAARKARSFRCFMRRLLDGRWVQALIEGEKTQHEWKAQNKTLPDGTVKPAQLLVGINILDTAFRMLKIVATWTPFSVSIGDTGGDTRQQQALEQIRDDGYLDLVVAEAIHQASVEKYTVLRSVITPDGIRVKLEDRGIALPLGELLPNFQPSVWERRWTVERAPTPGSRDKVTYLRVERQRRIPNPASGGAPEWAIECEAYEFKRGVGGGYCDTLVDLSTLKRIPVARALADGEPLPDGADSDGGGGGAYFTGLSAPTLVLVYTTSYGGEVGSMITEGDFGLIDAAVAAVTRAVRTMAIHGSPKVRVPPHMINAETNEAELGDDAIEDADKLFEYITAKFEFDQQLNLMNELLNWLLVRVSIAPALLGVKLKGGAAPESYDKLRLEATQTLAIVNDTATYINPALSQLLRVCSELDARTNITSAGGYAVARVKAQLRPQLPKDRTQLLDELATQHERSQISLQDMLEQIHGIEGAERILAQIAAEKAAGAALDQQRLGLGMGFNAPAGGAA